MKRLFLTLSLLIVTGVISTTASAGDINLNLLSASPEGSWQLREDIETDHKGRKSGVTTRTSMLSSETRDGEKYHWIEVSMDPFKISKKGKRKKNGGRVIMKSLISEATLKGDPANVINNLRGFGVETIIQNGNEDPMRMGDTGGMMAGIMKSLGTEIEYDFEPLGNETVTVPAGEFQTEKIRGEGSVSMKIVFKKLNVESDNTVWVSSKVPFGTVKVDGVTMTNGKRSTHTSELLEYGKSGAVSEITKEPQDMPEMPKLGDLFGG